jgi:negative regulator of flagellin synthesis FlgM
MTHKVDGGFPLRPVELPTGKATSRAGSDRDAPVSAAPAADTLRLTGEAASLQAMGRELGEEPASIDVAKVNSIRAALADGTYRINPQEIANRLLALERALAS